MLRIGSSLVPPMNRKPGNLIKIKYPGFISQNVTLQFGQVHHIGRVLSHFFVKIIIIHIIAYSDKFLVHVGYTKEHDSQSNQIVFGYQIWVWSRCLLIKSTSNTNLETPSGTGPTMTDSKT